MCALEAKEQQLKWTQSGSSELKRMHPAEADAVGEQHWAGADAIRVQFGLTTRDWLM